ncbi:hypothetical protein VU06_03475 [Desulfobulbus sp. F3]|nr:hypothetical protein [Desulfobulbus sp. F3]
MMPEHRGGERYPRSSINGIAEILEDSFFLTVPYSGRILNASPYGIRIEEFPHPVVCCKKKYKIAVKIVRDKAIHHFALTGEACWCRHKEDEILVPVGFKIINPPQKWLDLFN